MSETYDPQNPNSNLDPQNEMHNLAKVSFEEIEIAPIDPEEDFNHGEASAQVFEEFCDELDSVFPELAMTRDERRVETIDEIWPPYADGCAKWRK
jgi:hypothetical protein